MTSASSSCWHSHNCIVPATWEPLSLITSAESSHVCVSDPLIVSRKMEYGDYSVRATYAPLEWGLEKGVQRAWCTGSGHPEQRGPSVGERQLSEADGSVLGGQRGQDTWQPQMATTAIPHCRTAGAYEEQVMRNSWYGVGVVRVKQLRRVTKSPQEPLSVSFRMLLMWHLTWISSSPTITRTWGVEMKD